MDYTEPPIVPQVPKPMALATHHVPTGETIVTPNAQDQVVKNNAAVSRRALTATKKRQPAVAAGTSANGVDALSAELQHAVATSVSTKAKRRRVKSVPPPKEPTTITVPTGPPKPKCQGCIHHDLLELKLMEPKQIRHYIKPAQFLETATCAGNCKRLMQAIYRASPKANFYYCDETLKGYYAKENDPHKADMECLLVLCSECHAMREVKYAKANEQTGAGKRRSRRGTTN